MYLQTFGGGAQLSETGILECGEPVLYPRSLATHLSIFVRLMRVTVHVGLMYQKWTLLRRVKSA